MILRRGLARRSFLARVSACALVAGYAGGGSVVAARRRRRAPLQMIVDSDPRDPARLPGPAGAAPRPPRGRIRTGYSDTDSGPDADPAFYGRRGSGRRRGGFTDNDSGPGADPVGIGHGPGQPGPSQRFVICPGNARCPRRLP